MRAFIYTGGEVFPEKVTEHPSGDDLVIAADAGYRTAKALGEHPKFLLGDFDSYREELPRDAEILRFPPEKDRTDTQLAVSFALSRGASEIVLIGGLGGRLDHTLSNLAILEELSRVGIPARITDGNNRARFLRNDSVILGGGFRYFSLIAADERVKGVTLEGCRYPLKNARLSRLCQYAVSNEIVGNCALVEVRRGGVFLVETR